MANTRKVLLSLHEEVAARLDQEPPGQKSAVADAVIAAHYGLSFEGTTVAAKTRQGILDRFKQATVHTTEVSEVVNDTEDPTPVEEVSSIVQENPVAEIVEAPAVAEPVVETEPQTDFVPIVQPLDPVEATREVQEPQPEPVAQDEAEEEVVPDEVVETPVETVESPISVPIHLTETPVDLLTEPEAVDDSTCPTCGEEKVTPICLNCL